MLVVTNEAEDIAEIVEVSGKKSEVKVQRGIVMEREGLVRSKVKTGPPVLNGLVVVKTQTKGGYSLAGGHMIDVY